MQDLDIASWLYFLLNLSSSLGIDCKDERNFILRMALIIDTIWFSRNQLVHSGVLSPPLELSRTLNGRLLAHLAAWQIHDRELNLVWIPPLEGVWKLNFDAAIRGEIAYLAVICRDSLGVIYHAASGFFVTNNPLRAEIFAALLACRVASFLDLPCVILEGDSLIACRAINEYGFLDEGPLIPLLGDIKAVLRSHPGWLLQWASQRQNSMAHLFAAWAARSCSFGFIPLRALPFHISSADLVFDPP
ncbi:hypothetical protein CJ030_MR6G001846 [Morella rubra]|uniref:RNase H type-1 domain-containing protein n=1 Tax=Morella rubra TaxID=262757 RepID=A0A6A1VB51_9ROSI|nr:hypothetical protein CJ030_MR6G001846 [Morella rubra]